MTSLVLPYPPPPPLEWDLSQGYTIAKYPVVHSPPKWGPSFGCGSRRVGGGGIARQGISVGRLRCRWSTTTPEGQLHCHCASQRQEQQFSVHPLLCCP